MEITIRLLAGYRRCLPEGHDARSGYQLKVEAGTRLGDVLADLPIPETEPYTYLLNGRHVAREQALKAGDVLAVFPAVGGG